ncbi:MAG: adenylate kinase [Candidatus Nanohaloarchaea archaeon]|jgi:adenylate kinase
MIVTITGTPGTGKTSVLKSLDTNFRKVHLTEYIQENEIGENTDDVTEVDTYLLKEKISEDINDGEEDVIIEGHLAHHIDSDLCIVLRCNPEKLEERLSQRDYSQNKVMENVESEALDVILSETVHTQKNVLEIDTTHKELDEVVEEVKEGIEKEKTGYGGVDWSESFQELF